MELMSIHALWIVARQSLQRPSTESSECELWPVSKLVLGVREITMAAASASSFLKEPAHHRLLVQLRRPALRGVLNHLWLTQAERLGQPLGVDHESRGLLRNDVG